MTEIKGILFDKDGTLFDFAATWEAWACAFLLRLSKGDAAKAEDIGRAIGFDMGQQKFAPNSVVIAGTAGEVGEALLPFFPSLTLNSLLDILNEEAEQAPQEQAVALSPLLSVFKAQDLWLGVATNDAEQPARAHLGQADVTAFFDFIAGYDSGFGAKPEPGQLLAFAAHVGLEPKQIVMVGDSTHDLRAGRAAGMPTVGVLTGLAGVSDLTPFADVVLPDIGHLPAWLATHNS